MATALNQAQIIGNMVRDLELKFTNSGSAVVNFGVATNRSWSDREGNKQEATDFHEIVAWGKLAEICANLFQKGSMVYVSGRMQVRKYEDRDGYERRSFEIVADQVIGMGKMKVKREEEQEQEQE